MKGITDCFGKLYDSRNKYCSICVVKESCKDASKGSKNNIRKEVMKMKKAKKVVEKKAKKTVPAPVKVPPLLMKAVEFVKRYGYSVSQNGKTFMAEKRDKKINLSLRNGKIKVLASFKIKGGKPTRLAKKKGYLSWKRVSRPEQIFA